MNKEEIDKWLDNEYGCSYTRLEELHNFLIDRNMKYQDELERYKNIIEKAITFINIFQDEKTLTLNYNDLRHLRGILKGNDFDLMILEDKLKELKGSDR